MTEYYSGRFSYQQRRTLGRHSLQEVNWLYQSNTQLHSPLSMPLQWMDKAYNEYVASLDLLRKEVNEDKQLLELQINLPQLVQDGIQKIFDVLDIVLLQAKLKKSKQSPSPAEVVSLSIDQVTHGLRRSDLTSKEACFLFLEDLNQALPNHKVLHYDDGEYELVKEVSALYGKLQSANKSLEKEKAETRAARKDLWRKAFLFDRDYGALKNGVRCVLQHTERLSEMKHFFKDLAPGWNPSTSSEEDQDAAPEESNSPSETTPQTQPSNENA